MRQAAANLKTVALKETECPVEKHYLKSEATTLFIGNLAKRIAEKKLKDHIVATTSAIVELRPKNGYAFVSYPSLEVAEERMILLKNESIDGRRSMSSSSNLTRKDIHAHFFIRNIGKGTSDEELKNHFQGVGEIRKVHIPRHDNNNPKGYGFVEFVSSAEASAGLALHDSELGGSKLEVVVSKPQRRPQRPQKSTKSNRGSRGGRGGRGRGGRGRGRQYDNWGRRGGWNSGYGGRRGGYRGGGGGQIMALDTYTNRMVPLSMDQVRQVQRDQWNEGWGGGSGGGGGYNNNNYGRNYRPRGRWNGY
eukprot:TRINITY_DN6076_c0_g1_i1.p1 TRINITY_DN6076_c0_g1~~TRINITY_DN6076_c0_g1_i1.p1  ORF type:complete len:351 (+),score=126.83 TRINITY_DN6076_c0_g1_i1:137-1054(+)